MLAYQDTIITSLENEFPSFFILLRDHTGYIPSHCFSDISEKQGERKGGTNTSGKCTLRVIMSVLEQTG